VGALAQKYENTDAWKLKMAAQMYRVQQGHAEILKLKVPPKVGALRAAVLNATTDCNAAMDKLARGIDHNSADDLADATALMQSCTQKIEEAKPELDALKD